MRYRNRMLFILLCFFIKVICFGGIRGDLEKLTGQGYRILGENHQGNILIEHSRPAELLLYKIKDQSLTRIDLSKKDNQHYIRTAFIPGQRFCCTLFKDKKHQNSYLYLIDTELESSTLILQGNHEYQLPICAPDGKHIAFYQSRMDIGEYLFNHGYDIAYGSFKIIDTQSKKVREVSPAHIAQSPRQPTWSPDSLRVSFSSRIQKTKTNPLNLYNLSSGDIEKKDIPEIAYWYDSENYIYIDDQKQFLNIYLVNINSWSKSLLWKQNSSQFLSYIGRIEQHLSNVKTPYYLILKQRDRSLKKKAATSYSDLSVIDLKNQKDVTDLYISKVYKTNLRPIWISSLKKEEGISKTTVTTLRETPESYFENKRFSVNDIANSENYSILCQKEDFIYIYSQKPVPSLVRYNKNSERIEPVLKRVANHPDPLWAVSVIQQTLSKDLSYAAITDIINRAQHLICIDMKKGIGYTSLQADKFEKYKGLSFSNDKNQIAFYSISTPDPYDPYWDTHEIPQKQALKIYNICMDKCEVVLLSEKASSYLYYPPAWSEDNQYLCAVMNIDGEGGYLVDTKNGDYELFDPCSAYHIYFWLPDNTILIRNRQSYWIYNPTTKETSEKVKLAIPSHKHRPTQVQSRYNPYHFLHQTLYNEWKVYDVQNQKDVTDLYSDAMKDFKYVWQEWDIANANKSQIKTEQ